MCHESVAAASDGAVSGITLNGGIFAGPFEHALPISGVKAIGRDAVMIDDIRVLIARADVGDAADLRDRSFSAQ
ncbi:hypothetical protein [Actinoplanes auranticolor]|uniref:Uncharacterized protein n=1 Tax=Actinoplanes auranticolor TaxID=47988 RepID=A0A919SI68_9ACTN|nr:hypothetical protein [Actinoplanes auranticolor]GIM71972.1 hypothetical protein Aau02nite_48640 [Actinoplanes auranticolor]